MEPASPIGKRPLLTQSAEIAIKNTTSQIKKLLTHEQLQHRLKEAFTSYYHLRYPLRTLVPDFKIAAIVEKTLSIGPYRFNGFGITLLTEKNTIPFETTASLSILKPEKALVPYPIEALEHILFLVNLSSKEIEVTEVKDKQFLSWGTISTISDDTSYSIECYSIKFTCEENLYHFYFDKYLRFFRNGVNNDLHYNEPLLSRAAQKECLKYASVSLKMPEDQIKITKTTPTSMPPEIGYEVEFNDGLLKAFYPCSQNEAPSDN